MFDEYKLGGKTLSVKRSSRNSSSTSGFQHPTNDSDKFSSSSRDNHKQARSLSTPSHTGFAPEKTQSQATSIVASPSEDDIWSDIQKSPKLKANVKSFNEGPLNKGHHDVTLKTDHEFDESTLRRAPIGRGALLKYQDNKPTNANSSNTYINNSVILH